jgi:protein-S-isoprenylcysteine O-methyltransferase Ste14
MNPMYLAIVVMLLGLAVWVGSLPMLIAPVRFLAFMSLVFIPYEERRLRETFGESQDQRWWLERCEPLKAVGKPSAT